MSHLRKWTDAIYDDALEATREHPDDGDAAAAMVGALLYRLADAISPEGDDALGAIIDQLHTAYERGRKDGKR